jgi:hypothetical protein
MLALKLARLIEKHSDELVQGLAEQIHASARTSAGPPSGSLPVNRPQSAASASEVFTLCLFDTV